MHIVTNAKKHAPAQIPLSHPDQLRAFSQRQEITGLYSNLISIRNPRREEFMKDFEQLAQKYIHD